MKILGLRAGLFFFFCVAMGLCGCSTTAENQPQLAQLKAEAAGGNADAQLHLGMKYDQGNGVRQDYAEAAKWYQLAANSGNADAQNSLGSLYQEGLGVPKDLAKIRVLFQTAAEQGEARAQCSLGLMYDTGEGVPRNPSEADSWYRKAAEQGFPTGMLDLGVSYIEGSGVPQDLVQAFMWLDLGRFYTQFSEDKKLKWRIRAALDELKKQMTPQQIAEGEALSKAWDQNFKANQPKS